MRLNLRFILVAAAALAVGSTLQAKLPWVKKAKELGLTNVQNCQSCHVDKAPKKDAKGEPYNDMGKFLLAEKAKLKAAEVDLAWLKDYKGK
jgi:hypothetical protein